MKIAKIAFALSVILMLLWWVWPERNHNKTAIGDVGDPSSKKVSSRTKRTGVLLVKGIGDVKYDRVMEQTDLKQLCGDFIPDEEIYNKTVIKVSIYLNGDKIVHITKGKGLYETEDLTAKALGKMSNEPNGANCEIVRSKTSWLTTHDQKILAQLWIEMRSTGWDMNAVEAEMTPVIFRHGPSFGGADKYKQKNLKGLYISRCAGVSGAGFGWHHDRYPKEETLRKSWYILGVAGEGEKMTLNREVGGGVNLLVAPLTTIEKWKPVFEERQRKQIELRKNR